MVENLPRVFTISIGVSFLETLARSITNGTILSNWPDPKNPFSLSDATIFLPTRRAARALSDFFTHDAKLGTQLLPKIVPLGGNDGIEDRLLIERGIELISDTSHLLPEINTVQRRLVLAKMVLSWAHQIEATLNHSGVHQLFSDKIGKGILSDPSGFVVAKSARDGLQLADALGHLIDTLVIHKKTWEDLHKLVPLDLADEYWRISRDFLEIAAKNWPEYCSANGVMDAAERRHTIIKTEAERLKRDRPKTPIIIAGSTGSMPATASLISSVSRLPNGAVILPGLDKSMDPEIWQLLIGKRGEIKYPSHPQAQLARLIQTIGVQRNNVIELGGASLSMRARQVFLSESMLPPDFTDLWHARSVRISDEDLSSALHNISFVEAEQEREEALTIAVALRGALETPGKTAALITPDRALAERVGGELRRWGITVDDSGGIPLSRSDAGVLFRLVIAAAADNFSPVTTLALLNGPGAALGLNREIFEQGKTAIDVGLLRTPLRHNGLASIREALRRATLTEQKRRAPIPEKNLNSEDWAAANAVITQLELILGSFNSDWDRDLLELLAVLEGATRQIAAKPDHPEAFDELEGAEALTDLISATMQSGSLEIRGSLKELPGFFEQLMAGITVSRSGKFHSRIKLWGLLEARLMPIDLVVLGGLDETVWPPETQTDPFLNRTWREELYLPGPEQRIGQTAHDLVEQMGASEIIITRAIKRSGSPTVASRFLQRMRAVAGDGLFETVLNRGKALLELGRELDEVEPAPLLLQPRPQPARDLLPNKLSVTEIETLRRDPYSIYAKHVLRLDPLDRLGVEIGARELGMAFHAAVAQFAQTWPLEQPMDAVKKLLAIGRNVFAPISDQPLFNAFWWPKFCEAAEWFIAWDIKRREKLAAPISVEKHGALTFELPRGGIFTLTGQADRIEMHSSGSFSVIDFKTGRIPTVRQVKTGFSPQLTLEAAMVKRDAFKGLAGQSNDALVYAKLGGRAGGDERFIFEPKKSTDSDDLVERHFSEFLELIDDFWNGARPFLSRPYPEFLKDHAKYDHLARVREWSLTGGGSEEEGEE